MSSMAIALQIIYFIPEGANRIVPEILYNTKMQCPLIKKYKTHCNKCEDLKTYLVD